MDSIEEAIYVGMVIAEYLHKTGRVLQAIEVCKECLIILHSLVKTIGNKPDQARCYRGLGIILQSFYEYDKAREYEEKALAIIIEIGDRNGQATSYGNLGTLFYLLGHYNKAREYEEKALAIRIEIGVRDGEAKSYGKLGVLFQLLAHYDKA